MVKKRREIKGIISRYTDKLQSLGIDVFQIILYGSYAKRKSGEYSDIDIAVVSPTFKKMDIFERQEILSEARQIGLSDFQAHLLIAQVQFGDDRFTADWLAAGRRTRTRSAERTRAGARIAAAGILAVGIFLALVHWLAV